MCASEHAHGVQAKGVTKRQGRKGTEQRMGRALTEGRKGCGQRSDTDRIVDF